MFSGIQSVLSSLYFTCCPIKWIHVNVMFFFVLLKRLHWVELSSHSEAAHVAIHASIFGSLHDKALKNTGFIYLH